MADGALYNSLSDSDKAEYTKWMRDKYGWRAGILLKDNYYVQQWQAMLASYERIPPTIGTYIPPGGVVAPTTTAGEFAPTVPADAYKVTDKYWYSPSTKQFYLSPRTTETGGAGAPPPPGGAIPTDLVMVAPDLYWSASIKKWFYEATGGRTEVTNEFALNYINQYQRGLGGGTLAPDGELAESKRQFDIAQAWREKQAGLEDIQAQHEMELQFERDRYQLLQGLPSDDWIRRYVVQNQPNPYKEAGLRAQFIAGQTAQETARETQVQELSGELDKANAEVQALTAQSNALLLLKGHREEWIDVWDKLAEAKTKRDELDKAWNTSKTEIRDWTTQEYTPGEVTQPYPSAREWMTLYVPGLAAGEMVTKLNVPTPSGQQLTTMSTSQLRQLGAYKGWPGPGLPIPEESMASGVRAITEAAALMQPKTPFTKTRWSPAGTRV